MSYVLCCVVYGGSVGRDGVHPCVCVLRHNKNDSTDLVEGLEDLLVLVEGERHDALEEPIQRLLWV